MATDQCYIALPKSCIGIFHCKARIESQLMQSIMPVGGVHGLSAQDGALRPKLEHQRVRILSPEFRGGGRHHVAVMAQAMAARGRRCCGTKSVLRTTGHVHSSTPVYRVLSSRGRTLKRVGAQHITADRKYKPQCLRVGGSLESRVSTRPQPHSHTAACHASAFTPFRKLCDRVSQ